MEKVLRKFQASREYLSREIAGEYVFVPIGDTAKQMADMGTPNETFQFLWEQFQEPRTVEEVISIAKEVYEDGEGRLEADIIRYVVQCLSAGILEEV